MCFEQMENSVFHFLTLKRHILAWFCVFWVSLNVKICPAVSSLCWSEKINSHFTRLQAPVNGFHEIWGNIPVVNIINHDKFYYNLFNDFDFTGGKNFHFHIGKWRRRYNSAALLRILWLTNGHLCQKPLITGLLWWGCSRIAQGSDFWQVSYYLPNLMEIS